MDFFLSFFSTSKGSVYDVSWFVKAHELLPINFVVNKYYSMTPSPAMIFSK